MLCSIHRFPDSFMRDLTKRCSIKLKDEEAEIEITGSQIKQEAPETNIFKMAEIKAAISEV